MDKIALFIDAFITDEDRYQAFDENIDNFKKAGFDIFVISNKILRFDSFSKVKYFEYDDQNRILKDKYRYSLCSTLNWWRECDSYSEKKTLKGSSFVHGFTNWTVLYNLKKIANILKKKGYTHLIRSEYDVAFKDYNLMQNIFKNFGLTDNNKKSMVIKSGFGCITNFFLVSVDLILEKIPDIETEDDYEKFLINIYGNNTSPVFEQLFHDLIKNNCEYLDETASNKNLVNLDQFSSSSDAGFRHFNWYRDLFVAPINDNKEFFMVNDSNKESLYVTYKTDGFSEILKIVPNGWVRLSNCKNFVEIHSSQMTTDAKLIFDLSKPCTFTLS